MSKISLYVWGLGFGYVHTLVKNLLIKFLMMLLLVAEGCKFDSCDENVNSESVQMALVMNTELAVDLNSS